MTSPQQQQTVNSNRPWDTTNIPLQHSTLRNANYHGPPQMNDNTNRSAPVLPPLPRTSAPAIPGAIGPPSAVAGGYNSYLPYGSTGYNSMGYGGYGSYGMPYRNNLYNSYGGAYGGVGTGYAMGYPGVGLGGGAGYGGGPLINDDAERRFIQYAEESSRNTFANVESIVRAFNSIAMMLDNTFFAMTSSFRAVLSVADNFGRLRSMFGHIWYSINIFRLFNWLYRKLMWLMGRKVPASSGASIAWKEAAKGTLPQPPPGGAAPTGSNWPTLAFLGMLVSAPYIISKFLPKYEDKSDPANWKSPGIKAKAAFDFVARGPSELTVQVNDEVTLAPTYVQDEMCLKNSGWAFGVCNGKSGIVPLNYMLINKTSRDAANNSAQNIIPQAGPKVFPSLNNNNNNSNNVNNNNNKASSNVSNGAAGPTTKSHTKKVSFGENQIFENVDLEDYAAGIKGIRMKHHSHSSNKTHHSSISNGASSKAPEKIISDVQENTTKMADRNDKMADNVLETAPETNIQNSDLKVTQKDAEQTVLANISINNSTPEDIKNVVQEILVKQENNTQIMADIPPVQTAVSTTTPEVPEITIPTPHKDEIQQELQETVENSIVVENSSPKELENVVQESQIAIENEHDSFEKTDLQVTKETPTELVAAPKVHETDNSTSVIEATSQ